MYTQELEDVYKRYEKAVHKKDREADDLKRFFCSSPLYDPNQEKDQHIAQRIAPLDHEGTHEGREFKDEGVYPGLGTYHYYHRIDGKLVAVGNNDITNSILNAQYFIYDPDY